MTDRRVTILRFWLFALAWILTLLLVPEAHWALWPVIFFPGQSGCFCCTAVCTGCDSGTAPAQMQADVAGEVSDGCSNCEAYNASWVMDFTQTAGLPVCGGGDPAGICYWVYRDSSTGPICGGDTGVCIEFQTNGPFAGNGMTANVRRRVDGDPNGDSVSSTWSETGPASRDCSAFSAEDITFSNHSGPFDCQGTPTFKVTSL